MIAGALPATADAVIVGGGIVGAATAFFAARAGLNVLVIERRPALATLTTPVSTGAFRLQFDNLDEIELVREGVGLFDAFAERSGLDGWDIGIKHQGYLFASLTDATLERSRRLVERQRTWGLTDVELLDGDEARRRFPYLAPGVRGARYRAADGWLDVKALAIGYATAASHAAGIPDAVGGGGAAFLPGTAVTGFRLSRDGSQLAGVVTTAGEVATDTAIIATGPFTATVAALAGVAVDVRPTRRQKLVVPTLGAVPSDAPMTIHEETAAHWRPAMRGALALFTDPAEPVGPAMDPVPIAHDWAFGLLDPASAVALARVAPFWADAWNDGAPTFHWFIQAGQYEVTPDRRPYLGPVRSRGPMGIHLNGGYSGHGIMVGAAASRLVIDLLTGVADAEGNPLRVDRAMDMREHDIL